MAGSAPVKLNAMIPAAKISFLIVCFVDAASVNQAQEQQQYISANAAQFIWTVFA